MAYKIFGENDTHPNERGVTHVVSCHNYICDDEEDVKSLPDQEQTAIGSFAFVISSGDLVALTTNGWKKVGG